MRLYNTLTRTTDDFTPLDASQATIYTCGPTVYDYAHVGHWFTYIRWDLVVRALAVAGYKPKWVLNITDVGHLVSDADDGEDKLEKGARREGKTAWEVAEFYTQDFLAGLDILNITQPDFLTKATEHIPEQIALIQTLEAKGFTYSIDDGVYFDTSKFEGYAEFAQLDLDDLQGGARVEVNTQKHHFSDFALWKFSPKDHQRDMEWDSPWGVGFPGWHIECSAMAMKYLGETIDIHAGGIDHIPIHHTNEIAQSEAASGWRFANYWLHSNHVMVNGEKISKSLNNGIRLQEISEKGIPPLALRLHVLESHYRSQSRFSWESLQAAYNRLHAYQAMAEHRWQTHETDGVSSAEVTSTKDAVLKALEDDLNTPIALAELSKLEAAIDSQGVNTEATQVFTDFLALVDALLGLDLLTGEDIRDEQKRLITERETARDSKDWTKSDELRDQLQTSGLTVKDTAYGAIWHRS